MVHNHQFESQSVIITVRSYIDLSWSDWNICTGIILFMCPANERWRYNITSSLIGWAHNADLLPTGPSRPKFTTPEITKLSIQEKTFGNLNVLTICTQIFLFVTVNIQNANRARATASISAVNSLFFHWHLKKKNHIFFNEEVCILIQISITFVIIVQLTISLHWFG